VWTAGAEREAIAQQRRDRVPKHLRESFLATASISKGTRAIYEDSCESFELWCKNCNRKLTSWRLTDRAMAAFCTHLFFESGAGVAEARTLLYAFCKLRRPEIRPKDAPVPLYRTALEGFQKQSPEKIGEPMPFGTLATLGNYFLAKKLPLVAAAAAVGFDTYGRPSEVLSLTTHDVFPPTPCAGVRFSRNGPLFLVVFLQAGPPRPVLSIIPSRWVGSSDPG